MILLYMNIFLPNALCCVSLTTTPWNYIIARCHSRKMHTTKKKTKKDALTLKNAVGGKNNATSLKLVNSMSTNSVLERTIYFNVSNLLLLGSIHCRCRMAFNFIRELFLFLIKKILIFNNLLANRRFLNRLGLNIG